MRYTMSNGLNLTYASIIYKNDGMVLITMLKSKEVQVQGSKSLMT